MAPERYDPMVEALRAGSPDAFTKVYNLYYQKFHVIANYRLGDKVAAHDVVHDVFTALWEIKERLSDNLSLEAYLLTSVNNRCIDVIRKNILLEEFIDRQSKVAKLLTQGDPAILKDIAEQVLKAIDELPPAERRAFKMFYDGLSIKEISDITGSSLQTIKNHLCAARKKLRLKLLFLRNT